MKQIELLAPAGDRRSLEAALKHGADAVYLGAATFGARATAGFDEDALRSAIEYAHLYDKRVYVTVNTLIKERELPDAETLVRKLDDLRADAILVQDISLARLIRQALPSLPLHASTQMSVHNAAGAKWLLKRGISRVVLARECELSDIEAVADTGIETEVFVHGALCVSVSGQCLLSSQIGGRSGNRGRCAQPCRMQYSYRGEEGAWLSPRDLCLLSLVPQLIEAGVSSFKIEGRLKRPEYVAIVTQAYRHAIDCAVRGKPNDRLEEDRQALLQIFNRGGFSAGYALGAKDAEIIYPDHVSHEGTALGQIEKTWPRGEGYQADLRVDTPLQHGDMLQIRGNTPQEFIYSGPRVEAGQSVIIRHHKLAAAGDKVFKLLDEAQLKAARESSAAPMPSIPLSAQLFLTADQPARLVLSDAQSRVECLGDIPSPAQNRPLTEAFCLSSIGKTGDSPFVISDFHFEASAPLFMTRSSLNALRRDALHLMEKERLKNYQRPAASIAQEEPQRHSTPIPEGLYVRAEAPQIFDALREAGADHILYSPRDFVTSSLIEDLRQLGKEDYLCLPKQMKDDTLGMVFETAARLKLSVVLDNVSHLMLSWPAQVISGSGIPVWNTQSMQVLKAHGVAGFVLSHELHIDEANALIDQDLPLLLPVYGRSEVMLLNHCPERSYRGLTGSQRSCRLCDAGEGSRGRHLVDRLGASFPLAPQRLPEGCLNRLLFHKPVHLMDRAFGRRWLISLFDEPLDTALAIVRYYATLMRGDDDAPEPPIPHFSGRLFEGVQ